MKQRISNPVSRPPHLLSIIWLFLPAFGLISALIGWATTEPPIHWMLAILFGLSLLCWGYVSIRIIYFFKRLRRFLRLLLAGDYDAGIRTRKKSNDEISALENTANQVADRLRTYDRLRAARVSMYSRALELLLLQSKQGIITANVEKETFSLNPVAQKILGVTRNSFSFESVLKPQINDSFSTLFNRAVSGRKTNTEGFCPLQLPGMQSPARLSFLIMPLRDRDETVRFAVLTLDASGTNI